MADEQPRESERHLRREARLKQARGTVTQKRVRVIPRDDELRKVLKHPASGGFRPEGSIEWPFDQFTKRRIRDGDVTIEEQPQPEPQQQRAETSQAPQEPRATRNQPPTSSTS